MRQEAARLRRGSPGRAACRVINETAKDIPQDTVRWCAEAVLEHEHVRGSLTVLFVLKDKIRQLNNSYRGKDEPTDVLTFPAPQNDSTQQSPEKSVYLGEIVVCPELLHIDEKRGEKWELCHVVVHGTFHLVGRHHEHSKEAHDTLHAQEEQIIARVLS